VDANEDARGRGTPPLPHRSGGATGREREVGAATRVPNGKRPVRSLPPSKPLTGPASPRRSVCAPAVIAASFYRRPALRTGGASYVLHLFDLTDEPSAGDESPVRGRRSSHPISFIGTQKSYGAVRRSDGHNPQRLCPSALHLCAAEFFAAHAPE